MSQVFLANFESCYYSTSNLLALILLNFTVIKLVHFFSIRIFSQIKMGFSLISLKCVDLPKSMCVCV